LDQADQLEPIDLPVGSYRNYIHHCHLLLLSLTAYTHFTVPWREEGSGGKSSGSNSGRNIKMLPIIVASAAEQKQKQTKFSPKLCDIYCGTNPGNFL